MKIKDKLGNFEVGAHFVSCMQDLALPGGQAAGITTNRKDRVR
jgi:hypothetical protein